MPSLTPRERLADLIGSSKRSHDIPSKLHFLHRLKDDLLLDDPVLLAQFLPQLLDLLADHFSPVRKFVAEIVGETGIRQLEFLPDIVPALISVQNDESPPVARQAIACGMDLFRSTFEKIAIQGLYSSELDDSLETSWAWMLKFKDRVYSIAIQPGCDGTKLLALKFVESIVLLYTPDPNGSSEPPPQYFEGNLMEFNVSWLRGGHPVLSVGDLSNEASRSLGLLLDQLRFPTVKSLSSLTIIVLINSVSTIAKKRPSFYGRILPVLLGVDPTNSIIKGMHVFGARHALKNAFLSCLESTHPGAAPWRDRLLLAVREMKDGQLAEKSLDLDFKINGNVDEKDDSPITNEEKPLVKAPEDVKGRKRLELEGHGDRVSDDDISAKRVKPGPSISEESSTELNRRNIVSQEENESSEPPYRGENDSGPVQQLVAMFGALVAQGEKAAASLEILISSISADLLAEVVMANMRHLPLERPKADENGELLQDVSLSRVFPEIASLIGAQQLMSDDGLMLQKMEEEQDLQSQDLHIDEVHDDMTNPEKINDTECSAWPTASAAPSDALIGLEQIVSAEIHGADDIESEIPGLSSPSHNEGPSETLGVSSFPITDAKDNVPEQETNLTEKLQLESLPSVSNDRSEELSPKVIAADGNIPFSSTATSAGVPAHFTLPKMAAPVVDLADDQKDCLQRLAFSRIIEAYKEISLAGASQVRSSLLSHIGFELPSDLGPWKLLQQYILSDYVNHEGHELVLRLLYRLYGEAEVERDFFHSTTASSEYETLLLNVAEALRDSFPPSDKSLSRLLGEVPSLPESVLKLLECLCSPGSSEKSDKESQSGDRVTQGLSTVWSLILLRPPVRNVCLNIALQSAVHHSEEVRMKAIRLIANKLYRLSYISQPIEEFAKDKLLSVIKDDASGDVEHQVCHLELPKDSVKERLLDGHSVGDANNKDTSANAPLSGTGESTSLPISEVQQCMSLYFALCTKKHSLFRQIFLIYSGASKVAKEAIHRQLPILVRTMGASSELLAIISDAPVGSENLLMQVLQTLTDGIVPSPDLIHTIKKLYDSRVKDVEILMPVLPFLQKEEVLAVFPNILNLPSDKFQAALIRILQGTSHAGLSPEEILIAIHGIDPERDRIPLKKVTDACNACFEQREIFTQQVLAKVLNQLVEQIPLPLLFMRTVLQAIGAFPALADFIMEILSRLVSKQIWKYPKLWVGFLKCALLTKPQSFSVLLQLPPAQLENALNRTAALREPLTAHASQPNIRSSLPRSVLAVLGLADSETSSQVQTSQAHTGDTSTLDKEAVTGQESSAAS